MEILKKRKKYNHRKEENLNTIQETIPKFNLDIEEEIYNLKNKNKQHFIKVNDNLTTLHFLYFIIFKINNEKSTN